MTRRIALDRPPASARIDGVCSWDRRPLPELGDVVVVQVYRDRRAWWLGAVVAVDEEGHRYSVVISDAVDKQSKV